MTAGELMSIFCAILSVTAIVASIYFAKTIRIKMPIVAGKNDNSDETLSKAMTHFTLIDYEDDYGR